MFPCTIFVRFATFLELDSTPTTITRTTTKLLLEPLSVARGQKVEVKLFYCLFSEYFGCLGRLYACQEVGKSFCPNTERCLALEAVVSEEEGEENVSRKYLILRAPLLSSRAQQARRSFFLKRAQKLVSATAKRAFFALFFISLWQ